MFNNPFGSFHDTVAEAKEEREQLDRLLTISTPRERLLVVAIGLSLLVFAAWLFFGNVSRSLAVDGVLVAPGLSESTPSVEALVQVERQVASRLEAGMPAGLVLAMDDGEERREGEVATISAVPLAEGLGALGSTVPAIMYRVRITLDESLDFGSLADRACRIVIELGRQSPIELLRTRQP